MNLANAKLAKNFLHITAVGLTALSGGKTYYHASAQPDATGTLNLRQFSFGKFLHEYDHVLGTSMELVVRAATPLDARECEWRVLEEIERLRHILSTYDPASEICRVMRGAPHAFSELSDLLASYQTWGERTRGALSANMGEVIKLWKKAAQTGVAPASEALRAAAAVPRAYNVDALGKGFIIDRAVEVARRLAPAGLINIGGDIRVWGRDAWLIGVANPVAPADNLPPLAQFYLREGAVATSGGYARNFTLGGRQYSHILDPRTLRPAANSLSATVVAADCVTANALSTAACILGAKVGGELARRWGASEHLIVDAAGATVQTGGFVAVAVPGTSSTATVKAAPAVPDQLKATTPSTAPATPAAAVEKAATAATKETPAEKSTEAVVKITPWPKDYQVTAKISLKAPEAPATGRRAPRRPYLVVWVENAEKKHIRTITVWGTSDRYLASLSQWWNASAQADFDVIKSVTRATRAPGEYTVVWDGLDEKGKPVPVGEYKIFVEVNREHGRHVTESVTLNCATETVSVDLHETPETDAAKIVYGPAPAPEKTAPADEKPAAAGDKVALADEKTATVLAKK